METLVDTTALFAGVFRRDQHHEAARPVFRDTKRRFHTTNAVLWEFFTLLRSRVGYADAFAASDAIVRSASFTVHYFSQERDQQVWATLRDLRAIPLSHADASLVVLGRELKIDTVFAFDRDFALVGMRLIP